MLRCREADPLAFTCAFCVGFTLQCDDIIKCGALAAEIIERLTDGPEIPRSEIVEFTESLARLAVSLHFEEAPEKFTPSGAVEIIMLINSVTPPRHLVSKEEPFVRKSDLARSLLC